MTGPRARLAVFSDDWGRHPSSAQHLVKHLLPRYTTAWINTIGTRVPALDGYALKRAVEKLTAWAGRRHADAAGPGANRTTAKADDVDANGTRAGAEHSATRVGASSPLVLAPIMWPSFRSGPGRALNRRQLARCLDTVMDADAACTVLTTLPIVADVASHDRARRWVYYCVDDFSEWPGLDGRTMLAMERRLVERADSVVVVSEHLAERISAMGREAQLLTHGVDVEAWRDGDASRWHGFAGLPGPYVVFWGVVDRRLDTAWVRALADSLEAGTLVFVGPHNNPEPALLELPDVRFLDSVPFDQLPHLGAAADVLVMPYADLPVTRAMQPLKLKEYLATGAPVVVRKLPATEEWGDCCDVMEDARSFVDRVLERLEHGALPAGQRASRRRLEEESWARKASCLTIELFPG